jgi:4-amino-4-deoxy-L-arabinose transferase-like glycosyltransferase
MMGARPNALCALWLLVVVATLLWLIGAYPLMDPDEGRNAEVAREMAASGDLLVPHLDGLPYMDKPFLYFAVVAAGIRAFGPSELVVRLPSLLATLLTVVLVARFARARDGSEAGWIAACAALVMPVTLVLAATVIFDATMTLFMVAAILALHRAIELRAERRSPAPGEWRWTVAAWVAMALGVMTKGPVALVVPLLAAAQSGTRRVPSPSHSWSRRGCGRRSAPCRGFSTTRS